VVAYAVDIEPTNRCNASCHFCPRDMSPHEGLMALEVFEQALGRVIEYREHSIAVAGYSDFDWISLCGEGEPLLNKNTPTFVRLIREAGLKPHMASNGSLLDERRGDALLEAGLWRIALNVGETGEDYERVYKLPWEKTLKNVLRFIEVASDQVEIYLVLVDHRRDPEHIKRMTKFWKSHGVDKFLKYNLTNRGGSLFLDHMQFDKYPEREDAIARFDALEHKPLCGVPFFQLFIGYDGQYYLCCADWQKQVPLGSVFDSSAVDIFRSKIEAITYGERVCPTCESDPRNVITKKLHEVATGEADEADLPAFFTELEFKWAIARAGIERLDPTLVGWEPPERDPKRLIPVHSD
jgi:MoaA/NifB/PqqE/SkfB family radical SAM enzyme